MRRTALVLIALGAGIALAGGLLRLAAWKGQDDARASWEKEAVEQDSSTSATYSLTQLSFPARGQNFFVMDGASRTNLLLGPVRVEWSVAPGEKGNCVIAAHRDTHFRVLKDLKKGEQITLERRGRKFQYRIVALEVVLPTDDSFYQPTSAPVLTLVTCYPFYYFGNAPKRFIVRAELLESNS